MDRTEILKKQNRVVVQLLWIAGFLAFLNNLLSVRDPIAGTLIIGVIGGLALIMSYLVYTNKMLHSVKYLGIAGIFITVFVFIEFTPGLLSYLTIYIALFILGIYQEQEVITIAGVLSIMVSSYAFFMHKEMIFHERYFDLLSLVSINFFILLACVLLIIQSQFGLRLQRDMKREHETPKK
ncbi:hypothetical protein [Isachenkonia alkalipeptolytica]|uniref:Uncharacterized protein n=1 Tax=Isachenkonia alkalipeptolytica TaxID=2565777 RepID=A0AA43XHM4_9CLOT|nr:hypothetical protein [Isachenkonia alkalipeptolytica]NBG87053.1 hypothetical protein [Isachenkonia alkalipeptolytica]